MNESVHEVTDLVTEGSELRLRMSVSSVSFFYHFDILILLHNSKYITSSMLIEKHRIMLHSRLRLRNHLFRQRLHRIEN